MKTKVYVFMMLMGCFFLVANVTNAQQAKSAEDRAKAMTDKMKEKLTLDDNQYQKVYDVNLKYAKKADEIAAGSGDKKSKAESLKTQLEAKDKDMKGILTSDQYKKYEDIKHELKSEMEGARKTKK